MRQAHSWLIGGAAGLSNLWLYLAFTSNSGFREITAGVIVAGLATGAAVVFATAAGARFAFRLRDLAQALRLPGALLADSVKILQALAMQLFARRGPASVLAAVVFNAGDNRLAVDAGRRALAITYNSATPNSIMLGVVEDQDLMIYHQLIPGPLSPLVRKLGAEP